MASLQLPTYKKMQYYNFHDTLVALVKSGFIA
jgi:hypothetical protein